MLQNFFNTLLGVISRKDTIITSLYKSQDASCSKTWLTSDFYLDAIVEEVEEVRPHLKENNSVYLEDELGDILWDYMNLLFLLEKEGKIQQENVYKNMLQKYEERVHALENNISWSEIKKKQKNSLRDKHKDIYG